MHQYGPHHEVAAVYGLKEDQLGRRQRFLTSETGQILMMKGTPFTASFLTKQGVFGGSDQTKSLAPNMLNSLEASFKALIQDFQTQKTCSNFQGLRKQVFARKRLRSRILPNKRKIRGFNGRLFILISQQEKGICWSDPVTSGSPTLFRLPTTIRRGRAREEGPDRSLRELREDRSVELLRGVSGGIPSKPRGRGRSDGHPHRDKR